MSENDSSPLSIADCPNDQRLGAFFYGGLASQEIRDVERHIDECESCRWTLGELAKQSCLSSSLEGGQPSVSAAGGRDLVKTVPAKLGRYVLRSLIGAGGMGVVFEAHDPDIDRRVAIKLTRRVGTAERSAAEFARWLERGAGHGAGVSSQRAADS